MKTFTALILVVLVTSSVLSLEPVPFTVNTKKWSHVLDEHFISITINPTDLLQGKVFGLTMNSTMAILKGLAPAYVRIGSADTAKYIFKKNRHPNDKVKPEDEFTVTETHWMIFNEVIQAAGLDAIVCLNSGHRVEDTNKWDTRNSLELISFSDSQGYNLTWQLGYEVQGGENLSGTQFGKDLNRLRTILNAFPRYQHAKLIGPDIRVIHKKEDVDFWNDVLIEAGPTLDAVTWHPRWPQPSKMKVSEDSDLGYEFPIDYLEWDKVQLNKILQRSIFKNSIWIGETKRESTGTFAEGLIWARRLVLAAKLGIEVVMKQPNLMDITHPKPEYWIALLHKRLLGKAVLETRSVSNNTDLTVISHCTNSYYWTEKSEKLQDGPITVFAVNIGGSEQKIQIKGTWTGRNQLLFQYVLSSGSDPDSVFSQVTYLNGEPLMMTDEGMLPDIVPKIKKFERGLTMKLPPYSVGFWVLPEAKVKICQVQPQTFPSIKIESFTPPLTHYKPQSPVGLQNIENINQFIVEKLKNPQSDSDEVKEIKVEEESLESTEKDIDLLSKENNLPRITRKIRQIKKPDNLEQLKMLMEETQNMLAQPEETRNLNVQMKHSKAPPTMEHRIYTIAEGISDAIKTTNQHHEFDKFLESAGLKQDFGSLMEADRRQKAPKMQEFFVTTPDGNVRLKRSVFDRFGSSEEEINAEKIRNDSKKVLKLNKKSMIADEDEENRDGDKNWKQSLAVPHQHDLKGLEEKYKAIIQNKLDNGKRKIDVIKKKIQLDGDKLPKKNSLEGATEIQEELIKKEIELISKAEETVVDLLNNQKKRQETLEDLIFDELNDVKEERINALREMQRNTKKQENSITKSIHKRQVQTSLPKPFLKTVEYIEKNFNLEPETVKKIKRSLEEKMGEMLHNYDVKKSAEGKPKVTYQREERKIFKRPSTEEHQKEVKKEWENELSSSKNSETDHLSKEKSYIKKPSTSSSRSHHTGSRSSKKHYSSQDGSSRRMSEIRSEEHKPSGEIKRSENTAYRSGKSQEPVHRSKKFDESLNKSKKTEETSKIKKYEENKKPELFENDSFELFNNNKFDMSEKRSDRKKVVQEKEEKPVSLGKKMSIENSKPLKISTKESSEEKTQKSQQINEQENTKEKVSNKKQEPVEEEPKPVTEAVSLKNDKERRMNMLKQISSMVDNMNSLESKGGRLKRMNYDEDLSDEFEPDRKPMKIHRRPRRASIVDLIGEEDVNAKNPAIPDQRIGQAKEEMEKEKLTMNNEEIIYETTEKVVAFHTTEAPLTATPPGKFSKYRNLRIRPNRRLKVTANNGEELAQKKRHLTNAERPYFDLDKKKIFKPKLRKINPRFMKVENDLLKDKKTETWLKPENVPNMPQTAQTDFSTLATTEMQSKSDSEVTINPFVQENKELMKNLEEIIEEEHFLDQTLNSVKGVSETTEKELEISGTNSKIKLADCSEENQNNFAVKTMKSTEESKVIESTPKPNNLVAESEQNFFRETTNVEKVTEASTFHMEIITKPPKIPELKVEKITEEKGSTELTHIPGIERDFEEEKDTLEKGFNIQETREKKFDWTMNEMPSGENFKPLPYSKEIHRERRATFLKNLKNKDDSEDEEDEEDYSSEERIRKFKQMLYRPSQPKKSIRNEISHTGSTLGADQFLKMAGSTMRVMFDDVIPEAYGQTKTKIQNMGLSEYIKEFGKLVEQMRNLDQIFLNIGEAAVKGYIKSNKAEKGPYIQVISRKKRETTGEDVNLSKLDWNTEATESPPVEEPVTTNFMMTPRQELMGQIDSTTNSFLANTEPFRSNFQTLNADQTFAGNGCASPGTSETITDQYRVDWNNNRPQQGPNAMDQADVNSEKTFEFRTEPRTEMDQAIIGSEKTLETNTQMERIIQSEKKETEKTKEPEATYEMVENLKNDVPTQQERVKDKSNSEQQGMTTQEEKALKTTELNGDEFRAYAADRAMGNWLNSYIKEDLKETISPWLKTTKDFVQQALTTLRRQKQISEILTKDGVNLIQKQTKKNLEKREAEMNNPMLPSYYTKHIEFKPNKKRETPKPLDETLIRHLRALKPGVYVVPSEEMTNVRSEQIINEAKDKSGMPNVVTLNIYYDKKNQDGGAKPVTAEQQPEPRINQDPATYYQNKAWDSVAGQYDQVNQYVPTTETETTVPLSTPFVSPLQMSSVYSPHSRVTNLPNSRLIQYPSAAYHYPGAPKIVSSYSHPPSVYNPVLYVQPETTFLPQPPGTKRQWHEFKAPGSSVVSSNPNSGWHLQFGPLPSSTRKSPNTKHPITSYNKNYMAAPDRKRSVDEDKLNPASTRSALPFWNFFTPSSSDGKQDFEQSMESKNREEIASDEATNSDDVKRIIEAAKKFKGNAAGAEIKESDQLEKLPQSRRKRSVDVRNENQLFPDHAVKKLSKRSSYPYHVQFKDHDILPQWLGTYQEIDNTLDDLPPHIRRSHIVSTPWSGEQEELLTAILDDDDYQEELLNMDDDDYYFFNDNSLPRYRRRPRSTDNTDSKMLQTNMIYKTPIDIGSVKQKELLKPGMKKLTDRDSSLEMLSEPKMTETKTSSTEMKSDPVDNKKGTTKTDKNPTEIQQQIQNQIQQQIQLQIQHQMEQQFQQQLEQKFLQQIQNQQQQQSLSPPVQSVIPLPQTLPLLTQQLIQPIPFTSQFKQNGTEMLPRTVNDDAFYYFFKYAYNSFVRVMKSMTELF